MTSCGVISVYQHCGPVKCWRALIISRNIPVELGQYQAVDGVVRCVIRTPGAMILNMQGT